MLHYRHLKGYVWFKFIFFANNRNSSVSVKHSKKQNMSVEDKGNVHTFPAISVPVPSRVYSSSSSQALGRNLSCVTTLKAKIYNKTTIQFKYHSSFNDSGVIWPILWWCNVNFKNPTINSVLFKDQYGTSPGFPQELRIDLPGSSFTRLVFPLSFHADTHHSVSSWSNIR